MRIGPSLVAGRAITAIQRVGGVDGPVSAPVTALMIWPGSASYNNDRMLANTQKLIDTTLLAGINHILYHGTPYSPPEEKWPRTG